MDSIGHSWTYGWRVTKGHNLRLFKKKDRHQDRYTRSNILRGSENNKDWGPGCWLGEHRDNTNNKIEILSYFNSVGSTPTVTFETKTGIYDTGESGHYTKPIKISIIKQRPKTYQSLCTSIILVNWHFHWWNPDSKANRLSKCLIKIDDRKHISTKMSNINYLCFQYIKVIFSLQFINPQNRTTRKRNNEAIATLGTCRIIVVLGPYIPAKSESGYASTLKIS